MTGICLHEDSVIMWLCQKQLLHNLSTDANSAAYRSSSDAAFFGYQSGNNHSGRTRLLGPIGGCTWPLKIFHRSSTAGIRSCVAICANPSTNKFTTNRIISSFFLGSRSAMSSACGCIRLSFPLTSLSPRKRRWESSTCLCSMLGHFWTPAFAGVTGGIFNAPS